MRAGKLDLSARKYVTDLDVATVLKYAIQPGDLLFTRYNGSRDLVGRCARVPDHFGPIIHPDKLIRIVPRADVIDSHFLALFIETQEVRRFIEPRIKTTAGQSGVTGKDIRDIPLRYPCLAEQRQIVDILEGHLSRLDSADNYSASATARCRAMTISALLGDEAVVTSPKIVLRSLLAAPLSNGRSVPTSDGGFPVLRLTSLKGDRVDLSERKTGAWTADDARQFLVQKGDFMVARGNGSLRLVGRGALVRDQPDPVAYPDTLIRLRIDLSRMLPDFLSAVWNSPLVRRQIESMARTTAGIYKVNQKHIESVILPAPDLDWQSQVCDRLDQIKLAQAQLTRCLEVSATRSAALRQALLDAAFSGRLTGRASDMDVVEEMAGV